MIFIFEANFGELDPIEIKGADIVITHHLPSKQSVPENFIGSNLNRFFVCNMEKIIFEYEPKIWIHGHTHDSCYYMLGKTRVVCNPFGYPFELNENFEENFVLSLSPVSGC